MKVALVGTSGQLGVELVRRVPAGVTLAVLTRADLDVAEPGAAKRAIHALQPSLIINAAAYTHVDRAESEPDVAYRCNADGPRWLAEAAVIVGARLVQVSTDFVFDGERPAPYDVNSVTGPVNVYGQSKLAGEEAVLEVLGAQAVVVRTSWLYASHGRNFVRTMLDLMRTRESLSVVVDQVGTPTWAGALAAAIWDMSRIPALHGLQHWTDEGVASWYDFAIAIQEESFARGLLGRAIPVRAIGAADYPTPARRPRYSVLDKSHTVAALGYAPAHWRSNLRKVLDELAAT